MQRNDACPYPAPCSKDDPQCSKRSNENTTPSCTLLPYISMPDFSNCHASNTPSHSNSSQQS